MVGGSGRVPGRGQSVCSPNDSHWCELAAGTSRAGLRPPRLHDRRSRHVRARPLREPRPEHGYCTDDMARVLVVATREANGMPAMRHLAMLSLRFLLEALDPQGKCRNRMNRRGAWDDSPALDDCWGRCIWGLGTAASHSDDDVIRHSGRSRARASHETALTVAEGNGIRGAGCGRIAQRPSRRQIGALLAVRCRRFDDASPQVCRMAVARAAPHLRQRHPPRGDDRRRDSRSSVRSSCSSGLDLLEWLLDRETSQGPSLGHPGRRQRPRRPWSGIRPTAH